VRLRFFVLSWFHRAAHAPPDDVRPVIGSVNPIALSSAPPPRANCAPLRGPCSILTRANL
jgi:hypothetical protein